MKWFKPQTGHSHPRTKLFVYTPLREFLRDTGSRNLWIALGLLVVGLTLTGLASLAIKVEAEAAAQSEFDYICNEIQINIANRLAASAQLLQGAAGFFAVTGSVTREEWRIFTNRLQVEQKLPGIQGIGFALLIPPEQLSQHIQAVRDEGFPNYTVRPEGDRVVYSSIIYLEPFADRNLRAFGYDMLSEPVRRAAMEQARDENIAVLSGKVVLVQETEQDVQAGTLMYLPVYRQGMPIDTVEQRRAAILGWVYSPYRMNDMINGTLSGWNMQQQQERQIYLQIYDGDLVSPETLLYDSRVAGGDTPLSAWISKITPMEFAGRHWNLRVTQAGGLAATADYSGVWIVLFGGTSISLLLFGLVISLFRTQVNARRIAARLTAELRESEEKYRTIFESSADGVLFGTPDGRIFSANPAACRMFGSSEAEICAVGRDGLLDVNDLRLAVVLAERQRTHRVRAELTFLRRDGSSFPGEITSVVFPGENGETRTSITIRDMTERKQLEEELRISLEKDRILFETFPLGITVTDPAGVMLESNSAAEKLLGLPRDLHSGRTIDSPEWRSIRLDSTPMPAAEHAAVRALREQRLIENVEMGIRKEDDTVTWLSVTAAPFPLPGYGVAVAYYDIGERIRAEEALRQSEITLRLLINATLDSILLLEPDGTIVIGNETVADRLRQPAENLSGRNAFELLPSAVAEFRHQQMQRVLQTGEPAHFEDERFGRWIDNSLYPVFNAQGQVIRIAIFGRDITEKKQTEAALRESDDRFRRFLEEVQTVSVQGYGPDGTTQYWNQASEALYGYSAEEAIGQNLIDLIIPPEMRADVQQAIQHMAETGQPIPSSELMLMRKDGSRVTVFSSHAIIQTPGRAQELFCVDIDISERKQAEAALAAAKEIAEAANRAKGEFLANMSHELRTPLNAILGFSQLMARDGNLTHAQQENLSIINRSGEYLLGLINDVLDMAKIEAGRVTLQEHSFDLHQMVGDLLTLFQIRAAAKGMALGATLDPGVPQWIYTDEGKLRQVLINLVGNAVKFTAAGSVHLAVYLTGSGGGQRLHFAVRDTGPGIAIDDIATIFEPFVQKMGVQAAQEGTGLGLPISRRFVHLLGGELTVTSSGLPGEGSLFQFDIPLLNATAGDMLFPTSVYNNGATTETAAEVQAGITCAGLPEQWVAQLRHAASTAYAARILALREQIEEKQPVLAAALQRWVDEYDYDAILAAATKENRDECSRE